ncbi:hypothetical protein JCM11491_000292, partial [Sporobolomyces phaffii]
SSPTYPPVQPTASLSRHASTSSRPLSPPALPAITPTTYSLRIASSSSSASSSHASQSVFGSPPQGVIGETVPREIIRIERDYSSGTGTVQFWPGWIWELEGRAIMYPPRPPHHSIQDHDALRYDHRGGRGAGHGPEEDGLQNDGNSYRGGRVGSRSGSGSSGGEEDVKPLMSGSAPPVTTTTMTSGDPTTSPGKKGGGLAAGTKRAKASGAAVASGGGDGAIGDEVKYDKDGNPKKKRKQLVACDSCRLRRVKCDRSEKMGGPCSECEKKKITCTDTYVKNKPKTVRSGKLIQQAKALYGDDPLKPALSPIGAETTPTSNTSSRPSIAEHTTPRPPSRQDLVQVPSASQSRLVHSQISRDISSELVSTFFSVLHSICPLVDKDQFEVAWNLAGQVPENLTPANECLAAVLQAWASRISDSPLIVGYGVPTLDDVRKGGGGDYTLVGNRRQEFSLAMKERALRLVDERGLLRISSAAACSALTLLEFLETFDDTSRAKTRGRYLMVGACEHLRNLNDGQCDDITEPLVPPEQLSGGTLLWMVYTRDALVALLAGRYSCFTEDDLTSLCDLFTNPITADVLPYISSNDARMLSGLAVASMFRHVVACVRTTITLLTSPLARRSRLQESSLGQIWSEIDTTSRFTAIFRQSVESTDFGSDPPAKTHVWFRDLLGIKGQHLLGIHSMICRRLDDEEARVAKEGGPTTKEDGTETYLNMLRRVKDQSDERFLHVAREWTAMIRTYGSEVLFSAFFTIEYTRDYLHHMVESPAWEQGGPTTYTWASKIEECKGLIETMQMVGWVWSGLDRHIHQARHSLARQGHRLQEHQQQLAQQRQRHNSYPQQQQQSYHGNPSDLYAPPQPWAAHSHSHTISHPPPSTAPQHGHAMTVSIPAPSLPAYYESNPVEVPLNYGSAPSYSASATDTSVPPTSLPPPQPNGLTSYTSPPLPLAPATNYNHASSTNPAYYHFQPSSQQNGGHPHPGYEMNDPARGGVIGEGDRDGGGGGYAESARRTEEIRRLPSMTYGNGTM